MIINKDTLSVKDLLNTWSNYVVTNISGETLYKCMTVTIEFPMIDFTKENDKQ